MKRDICFWPSALLAFLVWFAGPRSGLGATSTISSGENQTGTITSGSADAYTFTGNTGDNIILRVGSTNFAPRIDPYAPGGALVASGFVNNSGYRDALLYYTLTNSGTFTAVVTGLLSGAGTYGLRLAYLPGSFVVPVGDAGGPLTNGTRNVGTMDLGGLDPSSQTLPRRFYRLSSAP